MAQSPDCAILDEAEVRYDMTRFRYSATILFCSVVACSTSDLCCPGGSECVPRATYIDEPVVMQSDTVVPAEQDGNTYTFDLSGIATIDNGDFNDLEVEYVTYRPDSDRTWVFDFSHEVWTELQDLSRDE